VAEGSVATNAVTALITGSSAPQAGQPIAGVAIRIIDPNNVPAASPYASCQGSTLSDNTGTAHCNLVATCGNGTGSFSVGYMVGDYVYYQGTVTVTKGSAQTLTILSGNNQTGNAGQALSFPLVATITDACGVAVGGASVTWTVTNCQHLRLERTGERPRHVWRRTWNRSSDRDSRHVERRHFQPYEPGRGQHADRD
jgi:hypothetical protein